MEFDPIAAAHHESRQRDRQKAQWGAPSAVEARLERNPNLPIQEEENEESTENSSSRPSSRNGFLTQKIHV